jgi:sortase A
VTTVDAGASEARPEANGTADAKPQTGGTKDAGTQAGAPAGKAAPATQAPEAQGVPRGLRSTVGVLMIAVLFCVGFFVYLYGFSRISESRAQATMFKNFVGQLAQATAPVGPTVQNAAGTAVPVAAGAPVAVLNIPQIGLRDVVVVNGTTSRNLARGPGHVPASVLPGQPGLSVIYGKVATFGAPFAHLMQLNRGDRFTVTTGQGTATYQVESFGTSAHPAPADSANRLILETAASSFAPAYAVQVSADLVSKPRPNPGAWPAITAQEVDMASDSADSLVPLTLWSQALLIAVIIATVAANRWSRWATYLCMAPVVLALTWCVYENLACLLPNLY